MPDLVCDTSPLQYLHRLHQLELLLRLGERVYVPPAVEAELAEGLRLGHDLPWPAAVTWLVIQGPRQTPAPSGRLHLGAGEREVLALAAELSAVAVLDDRAARTAARSLGVSFTGTLGLLLDAKQAGLVEAVAPLMDELEQHGFRVSGDTRELVLRRAREA